MTDRNTVTTALATLGANGWDIPATSPGIEESQRPIVIEGGDHPYSGWYNNGNRDGFAQIYRERGLPAYLAINTDDPNGEYPGGSARMSWAQIKEVANGGVEITSHGARHINSWIQATTGFTVQYIGGGSAATLTINSAKLLTTTITADPGGHAVSFDLTLPAYDTLAELVAAFNSQAAGAAYQARLAPELLGTEKSTNLMQITAVNIDDSITAGSGATIARGSVTQLGRNVGCSGGMIVQYNGTAARTASARKTSGNRFELYEDGVPVVSLDLTAGGNDTLTEIVALIDARTGWDALVCDNGYSTAASDGTAANNFCSGSELTIDLTNTPQRDCTNHWVRFNMGLPAEYVVRRNLERSVEIAAAQGVMLRGFSQSGGGFFPQMTDGQTGFDTFRGDAFSRPAVNPMAAPASHVKDFGGFYQYKARNTSMTYLKLKAVIDAMIDSGPWMASSLVHKVTPDGYSGYTLPNHNGTDDLTETVWIQYLNYLRQQKVAGNIDVIKPKDLPAALAKRIAPRNLIFNPLFRNHGGSIDGLASDGEVIPGWLVRTTGATATVDDTLHSVSCVGTAGSIAPISQDLILIPGETYRIGINVEFLGGGVLTNGVRLLLQTRRGRWKTIRPTLTNTLIGEYITTSRTLSLEYTHQSRKEGQNPYVRSANSEPFNLAVNNKIRLSLDAIGNTADIDISTGGASAAATRTAYDIANKINAGLLADALYGAANPMRAEYCNVASAENGRVVIQLPYKSGSGPGNANGARVIDGTATSALTTVFGNAAGTTEVLGESWNADPGQSHEHGVLFAIEVNNCAGETIRFSRPFCQLQRYT